MSASHSQVIVMSRIQKNSFVQQRKYSTYATCGPQHQPNGIQPSSNNIQPSSNNLCSQWTQKKKKAGLPSKRWDDDANLMFFLRTCVRTILWQPVVPVRRMSSKDWGNSERRQKKRCNERGTLGPAGTIFSLQCQAPPLPNKYPEKNYHQRVCGIRVRNLFLTRKNYKYFLFCHHILYIGKGWISKVPLT